MSATVRENPSSNDNRPLQQPAPLGARSMPRALAETDRVPAARSTKDERPSVALEPHWLAAIDVATD